MEKRPKGMGDFTIGGPDSVQDDLSAVMFREELNELKIEKLSTRITTISIIIPCLIAAILFFAYMEIKARMADVENSEKSEIQEIADALELKFNALTVDFAGIKHQLETTGPVVDEAIKKIESAIANLKTEDNAKKSEVTEAVNRIEKAVADNEASTKLIIKNMEETAGKTLAKALADSEARNKLILKNLEETAGKTLAKAVADNEAREKLALKNLEETAGRAIAKAESATVENTRLMKAEVEKTNRLESAMANQTEALRAEKNNFLRLTKIVTTYEERIVSLQKELGLLKVKTDAIQMDLIDEKDLDRKLNKIRSEYNDKIDHVNQRVERALKAAAARPAPVQIPSSGSILEKDLLQ